MIDYIGTPEQCEIFTQHRMYENLNICESILFERYHTLDIYVELLDDISMQIIEHINDGEHDAFYSSWVVDSRLHKPAKQDKYDKCNWIFPVFIEFEELGPEVYAVVKPYKESKDRIRIIINKTRSEVLNFDKIYHILDHEFVHAHQSYGHEGKDILSTQKNIGMEYAPELSVDNDIYKSKQYDKTDDLFSKKLRKRMMQQTQVVYAYDTLMYISSETEENARVSTVYRYVKSLDYMQLNNMYEEHATRQSTKRHTWQVKYFSPYDRDNAIVSNEEFDREYCHIHLYGEILQRMKDYLIEAPKHKGSLSTVT